MPPKRRQQEESDSDDGGMPGMGGMPMDFARFMNPNIAVEFKAKLPGKIRDRVKALEALDEDYKAARTAMSKEMDAAERAYQKAIQPLNAQRAKVLRGEVEPTDAEVKSGFTEEHKEAGVTLDGTAGASKGIERFWLEALQHHVIISEFITERDAEALAFVTDVRCETSEDPEKDCFKITFDFAENPYFTNASLSKQFTVERKDDETVLSNTVGSKIEWKEGKNLAVKTVTKKLKPKGKKGGQPKFVTSEEPCETFFDFFSDEAEEEANEEWMAMAETLKDKIIPFAVDYFTGEAGNGESDMEDEDYDGEEEEEEEEDDEPMPPMRGGRGGGGGGRGGYSAGPAAGGRGGAQAGGRGGGRGGGQQECKQQ